MITGESVISVVNKQQKVPHNLNEKAKKEEKYFVEMEIIEAVPDDQLTTCCTNPVRVPKRHNPEAIRYCSDMTAPHTAIMRPVTKVPTVTDIKFKLDGAKVFSVLNKNDIMSRSWRKAVAILLRSMVLARR